MHFSGLFSPSVFFSLPTMEDLRKRLTADQNLRMICGFSHVPSLATFSRRLALYAKSDLMNTLFDDIVRTYLSDKLIGHISRDSTAISAREKAINTKSEVKVEPKKRGRPRKEEIRPEKEPSVLEKQIHQSPDKSLSDINKRCAWGAKKNSQGNMSYWKGYKIHFDVTDFGIPVTAIVTGANVHDSQLAIPMEQITGRKITYLYSLMDAAYDAEPIILVVKDGNHVPLIDPNKRRKQARPAFTDCEKKRYAIRTTVERANSHLKDWFIPERICVRGYEKTSFILMCGIINLTIVKLLQYYILPELQKTA